MDGTASLACTDGAPTSPELFCAFGYLLMKVNEVPHVGPDPHIPVQPSFPDTE